jgi:hypothetical protein
VFRGWREKIAIQEQQDQLWCLVYQIMEKPIHCSTILSWKCQCPYLLKWIEIAEHPPVRRWNYPSCAYIVNEHKLPVLLLLMVSISNVLPYALSQLRTEAPSLPNSSKLFILVNHYPLCGDGWFVYPHVVCWLYRALQSKRIVIFIICNGTSHLLGQAINPFSAH